MEDVEPAVGQGGRQRVERVDDLEDLGRDGHSLGPCQQRRGLREPIQVLALGPVEPERLGQRVEHLHARVDLAALLQPRVPGDADARKQRQLLAAQPGRAPPRPAGHAEVLGRQLRPPGSQELAQFLAPPVLHALAERPLRLAGLIGHHDAPPRPLSGLRLTTPTDIRPRGIHARARLRSRAGHAIAVTLDWVAVATAFGALAAVPLTRTVPAARRGSALPPRLSPIGDRSRAALRV
jgi:hypothetical protein